MVPGIKASGLLLASNKSSSRSGRLLPQAAALRRAHSGGQQWRSGPLVPVATSRSERETAAASPGKAVVVHAGGMLTYGELDVLTDRMAAGLYATGGMMAGVNNNGNHSANAITALFAATGQDIANVAESSAALVHTELLADGSYYYSITIPALIVATYGGGTGLPTQRECLELLGCYGAGKVCKLAEIIAATILCGEISLGSAVVADEWVAAHERLGRNRP